MDRSISLWMVRLTCRQLAQNNVPVRRPGRGVNGPFKAPFVDHQSRGSPLSTPRVPQTKIAPTSIELGTDLADTQPSQNSIAEFMTSLQHYGRSVIKSALEHTAEESRIPEKNIIASKEKVIAHCTGVSQ